MPQLQTVRGYPRQDRFLRPRRARAEDADERSGPDARSQHSVPMQLRQETQGAPRARRPLRPMSRLRHHAHRPARLRMRACSAVIARPGGSVKRSLAMVSRTCIGTIAKSCGLDAATQSTLLWLTRSRCHSPAATDSTPAGSSPAVSSCYSRTQILRYWMGRPLLSAAGHDDPARSVRPAQGERLFEGMCADVAVEKNQVAFAAPV
jgi:hypothetical protein